MKRLLAIFVAALLITGCSTTGGREKQEQETRQVQPQSSPQSNRQTTCLCRHQCRFAAYRRRGVVNHREWGARRHPLPG